MRIILGMILGLGLFFLLLSQWGMNRGWRKNVTIKINHMPNPDGTANVKDALKHIGVALVGAIIIYLTGSYLPGIFLLIIPPSICGIGGWLAASGDPKNQKIAAIVWGGIGLIAGLLFLLAK